MNVEYKTKVLRELRDQQARFAPREKRLEQLNRAEKLIQEIEAERNYSYEYLCYRITDFRPEATPHTIIVGADVLHDLRLFVEDLSDSADVRPDEVPETVVMVEDLSKEYRVSVKTVGRWRQLGLVGRRFLCDGRKRVGFLRSSVDHFVRHNRHRVERGERFSQLTNEQKGDIIDRARRLAKAGGCPAEVARRLAEHTGRSLQTIRLAIRQFDGEHPDLAVFPDPSGRMTDDVKVRIYTQYREGTPVERLMKLHCRTKTSVYRIINEMRAKRIMELPLESFRDASFDRPSADRLIRSPLPVNSASPRKARVPAGLPPYLAALYDTPLLNSEQELHLFRRFNYVKYRAEKLRKQLNPADARSQVMDEIEALYDEAVGIKNDIVQANLRLVVSIAKRHVNPQDEFFELISDGNISLMRAAEKFDFTRGFKFSTYASWSIIKNFARSIPEEHKRRDRFRNSTDEMFSAEPDGRSDQNEQEAAQEKRETQIGRILSRLDERELMIIKRRYGIGQMQQPQTLKEVGDEIGVTKERVRQIEIRALGKLRQAAAEEQIELPELDD